MNRASLPLLGLLLLAGYAPALAAAQRPAVFLISIDTLRSDRLPAYGYRGVATPAIDAFARDAILFEHAFSHVPLTLPAHASLFTGRLPRAHGVRDNLGYRLDPAAPAPLAEILRDAGWATGGAVSSYVLRAETGIARGFEFFDAAMDPGLSVDLGAAQRPGGLSVDRALAWLAEPRERPPFFFLHLYEPHTPYEPPSPFRERYRDPYDGEIAAADALVGRFLDALRERGLYDRSLIVLLSDHGEGLGDHGEDEHGLLLYREAIQVPLLVKLPGGRRAGERARDAAGLVDVLPTLLDALALPIPGGLDGRSLLGRGGEPRTVVAETFYPRIHFGWSHLASAIRLPYQVIEGPDPELYDLHADPAQTKNIRASERRALSELRSAARTGVGDFREPADEDPETAKKLAALGYLGSRNSAAGDGPLADPKAMLPVLRRFRLAESALSAGQPQEALPVLEQVVAESPGMTEGWLRLGQARGALGQTEGAIEAQRKALEASGGSAQVALALAQSLRLANRLEEARQHARLAQAGLPAEAHSVLAGIELTAKNYAAAEREARAALEAGGRRLAGLLVLTKALIYTKRPEEALATIEQAERELAALPQGVADAKGLFMARGDVMLALRRPEEAFRAYQREIQAYPDNALGYVSAALVLGSSGRPQEGVALLRSLVTANPADPGAYRAAVLTMMRLGARGDAQALLREGLRRFPADAHLTALAQGKPVPMTAEPIF